MWSVGRVLNMNGLIIFSLPCTQTHTHIHAHHTNTDRRSFEEALIRCHSQVSPLYTITTCSYSIVPCVNPQWVISSQLCLKLSLSSGVVCGVTIVLHLVRRELLLPWSPTCTLLTHLSTEPLPVHYTSSPRIQITVSPCMRQRSCRLVQHWWITEFLVVREWEKSFPPTLEQIELHVVTVH